MISPLNDDSAATEKKIAALIEQLRLAERELQELTGGKLDAITAAEGSPILLRDAQHQAAEMQMAVLNALPAHIALLDHDGVILAVNEAWRRFASANILQSNDFFIGQNYIGVCESAHGDCAEEAQAAADGIRQVLRGEVKEFSLEYPCHSPTEQRWFRLMVTTLGDIPEEGAVVMHVNVTQRRLAEEAIRSQARELAETGQTLTAVTEALGAYVERGDWKAAMGRLVRCALDQTQSEYGFIGVVVGSTLRVLAHEGIVWDKVINREFFEEALRSYEKVGYLEFTSFNNLFGSAITTGKVVIANMPDSDPRSSGRPSGHPPMRSFLGVPIFVGGQVQGMVALANRPGGYSEDEQRQIETLVQHAGGLCTSYRQREAAMVLEQERAKTQAERNRMFNLSMDLLAVGNFDGELEQVNPAWTLCLGWSAEELTNRPWLDFVHSDDHAATIRAGAEISSGLAVRDFENRYLCKDGSYRWLSWNAHPLMESRQIFCVARDVTERRKNEAQLRLLETCVSRLNDIVLITEAEPIDDPGPRILYVNDAFVRRTGFSREEAIGQTPRLLQGPKTQRDALDRIRASLKAWKPVREELINYTKSGEEFWLELDIVPVADEKGWFTHWVAIERDITERKQVEEQLRKLSQAVEQSPTATIVTDLAGNIEYVNPKFTESTGYTAEEVIGKNPRILNSGENPPELYREMWATITAGKTWRGEMHNRKKNGDTYWEMASISPVLNSTGKATHYLGLKEDITERRKNEEQLRLLETCVSRLNDIVLITEAEPIDDPGPRILYVNDAFVRRTGFTREEAIGQTPRMLQGPKTQRDALDRIRASLKAWKPVREELINYTKSGEEFWLELDIVPVANEKGWFTHWVAIERDITERKQVEATLAESQRQYRDLVETSHNVIWAVDVEGRFTFLNQASLAIYGLDPEEMIGRRFHEFVPEDQHQANDEVMASMLRDGRDTIDYTNRIRRQDGSIAILNSNARVVRDAEGLMIGISGMSQDTTESLKAQAALAASEQRLRLALDAANMGTFEWDVLGESIVWSREHEELWGYAPGEFNGTYEAFAKPLHPDDLAEVNAEIIRCMSAHERFIREFRVLWPGGSVHWMASIGEFSYDKAGQPLRMHGAVMEVTERKQAQEALQVSEKEFRNLAEAMPQIVWTTRADGWTTYFNQHWMDYTGLTLEESLGHGWNKPFHPEDQQRAWDAWELATTTLGIYTLECRLLRADGEYRWWLIRGEPQKDAAGKVLKWFGTCTDIHDLKVAELEITRTNRALKLLSACNELLIHAEDETTLLRDLCELAVQTGGYRMAWVGYARDDEKRTITPAAHAGVEDGYLAEVNVTWDEQSRSGQGPAGRVIRSGEAIVCEDLECDEFSMWINQARQRGYRSVICLPLRDKQRTIGLLGLYSAEVHVTNAEEQKLLQEMADDLAFGILSLRTRIDQRRTHEAVLTMARGISASSGDEFFEKLTFSMVEALGAHAGFIARLNDDKSMATTLCAVVDGKLAPDFEYALSGTPCEHLGSSDVWVVPKDVRQHYPQANLLQDLSVNAYVGTELYDADGKPCGQMCVLFQQPLAQHEFISSTLKIFASRAAGELERQKTDGRLREQAALLDKAQDAILVRDLNHKILYWNRSAERLYGWSAEEAVGRTIAELIYKDTALLDATLKVLIEEGEWIGEVQQFTKEGKALTVEGRWSLVRDEQGNPKSVLAINTDVTERKKIEAQYLRAQRMESIGTLAGGIAHDLNNVLAPIMMAIELLKMQEENPMRLSVLTTIEGSAKRGADMVKQVLSFARGVEGQQLEVQVGHLLREIEKIANETFLKSIHVSCEVPADLWLVTGDPTQLHQVLLNLCVNARDAMSDGGRLSLAASNLMLDEQYAGMNIEAKPGPHVRIVVEDSGTGMPPEVIERIFEPFFTTKELGKGTGLGLSTTLAIIKSHGGFVRVYSEVGMGTRFHVYLPAQTEPGAAGSEAAEPELPRGNGELVLVIDDEAAVRQITRQTLEAFGYRVMLATDGVEATSIYATQQNEIDVVLTDMMMPLMDGPTTIQVLLRMNPQARIIAASGLNANGMVAKVINAGVKHFIPKPYTAETLLKTLRDVLGEQVVSGIQIHEGS